SPSQECREWARPTHGAATARRLRPEAAHAEGPTANWQPKALPEAIEASFQERSKPAERVPQTAPLSVVTRRYKSRVLNRASHWPEDDHHDRRRRSVRRQTDRTKRLSQYRTAGTRVHVALVGPSFRSLHIAMWRCRSKGRSCHRSRA